MADNAPKMVPVFTPEGELATVPEHEYESALKFGGIKPASKAEVDEYLLRQKASSQPIRAAAEGLARSATFGLSDYAAQKMGVPQEELRARKEENPIASIGGEIAGDVAGMLLPGGSLIKAGKLASRGAVAATASEAIRASLGASKIAPKLGTAATRAVERAGVGSSVGLNKIASKVAGGALEGTIYGARNAVTEDALGNNELTAESLMTNAGLGAVLGGGTAGALSVLGSGAKALGKTARGAAERFVKLEGKTAADFAEESAFSALKPGKAVIKRMDSAEKKELGRFVLDDLKLKKTDTIDDIVSRAEGRAEQSGSRLDDLYLELDAKAPVKPNANEIAQRIERDVIAPLEADTFKRDLAARVRSEISEFAKDYVKPELARSEVGYKRLWDLRKSLDEKINWNKTDVGLNSQLSKVRNIFNDVIQSTPADATSKALVDELKATNKIYSLAEKARKLGQNVLDSKEAASSSLGMLDRTVGAGGAALGAITGGFAPGVMLGLGSAVASKAIKERGAIVAASALDDISKLGRLEQGQKAVTTNIADAIKGFFSGVKKVATPTAYDTTFGGFALAKSDKKESRRDAAIRRIEEVRDAVSDPDRVMTSLAERTRYLQDVAPNTSLALQQTALRATQFLNEKLPRDPHFGASITPLVPSKWQPTGLEIAKAMRYIRAVEDPKTVLADIKNGEVSVEAMDALRAVYPNLFTEVVNAIYEQASSTTKPLSYNQKVQLSIITGTPMDSTMEPQFIGAMQKTFAAAQPQKQQGAPSGGGRGVSALATSSTTPGQKVGVYK